MRDIVLLGLNHKTAPVDVRECIAFTADETDRALVMLRDNPTIGESVLFSTCNRIELLMAVDERDEAVRIAKSFIAEFKKVPLSQFENSLYQYVGDATSLNLSAQNYTDSDDWEYVGTTLLKPDFATSEGPRAIRTKS